MAEKKEATQHRVAYGLSVIRACWLISLNRSGYYHQTIDWRKKDSEVIAALQSVLDVSPHSGFWKCYFRLRFQNHRFNHKRVYRVYCRLGLNLRRRRKKSLPTRQPDALTIADQPNRNWALDFMHDTLYSGKRFRTLNVLDEVTRECLAIETDTSLPAERVIRVLERLKTERGLPHQLRVDNGPELISGKLCQWCENEGIT